MTNWDSLGYEDREPFFLKPQDTKPMNHPPLLWLTLYLLLPRIVGSLWPLMAIDPSELAHSHDTGQAKADSGGKIYKCILMAFAHCGGL